MRLNGYICLILSLVFAACQEHAAVNEDHEHTHEQMPQSAEEVDLEMSLYQVSSQWTNQNGDVQSLGSLAGHVQLVVMTYTMCEFSCPLIVADLKKLQASLSDEIGFTLVSIDPERDTPARLRAYAKKMNLRPEQWTLLNGEPDDILELAALLGVRFQRSSGSDFAHSNMISVLDEYGRIIYQQKGLGNDLVEETEAFVRHYLGEG